MAGYAPIEIPPVTVVNKGDSGAVETVILTTSPVSTPGPNATVTLSGTIFLTAGTGAASATVQVRRGTTTAGTLVGEAQYITVAAGGYYSVPFVIEDHPGDVAGQEYVVTIQEGGATAAGTVNYGFVGGTIS